MLAFRYKLPDNISSLMGVFENFYGNYIDGYVDEGDLTRLKYVSLYLLCESETVKGTTRKRYFNPIGIIARNENEAVIKFGEVTGKIGLSFAELSHTCENLKVEPK